MNSEGIFITETLVIGLFILINSSCTGKGKQCIELGREN